jgi:RHS repeat-associated protein
VAQRVNNSRSVLRNYRYNAFGEAYDGGNGGYNGEYWDAERGEYYLRARSYNPRTGRFTQEDPIRHGFNWYTYCSNDPVNRIDPSGLKDVMLSYILDKNEGSIVDVSSAPSAENGQ